MDALPQLPPAEPELLQPPPAPVSGEDGEPDEPDDASDASAEPEEGGDNDEAESPLSFIRDRSATPLTTQTVSVAPRSNVSLPTQDHRIQSILTAGARSCIAPGTRHQLITVVTPQITQTVSSLVQAGVISPGRPTSTYRLFLIPKNNTHARILYDLSLVTPRVRAPPCHLPRAMDILADTEARFAIKLDLKDGFFHVPIHPTLSRQLGIRLSTGEAYCWNVLPMGLASAPALMQMVTSEAARLVQKHCPGVRARVYLDDFLFKARTAQALLPVAPLLSEWGFNINVTKSVLVPSRSLTYLGIQLDLQHRSLRVHPVTQRRVLRALALVPTRGILFSQRVAGYLNFILQVAKLPLQLVAATLQRLPALSHWVHDGLFDHPWEFSSRDYHERFRAHPVPVFSDATPAQLGWHDGSSGLGLPLARPLPIYVAELLAALLATVLAPPASTVWIDNTAALINVHKGRCPNEWIPWVTHLHRDRRVSFRYIPSGLNLADGPSRAPLGT